nr:p42=42 kda non-muscle cytoplasmic actin [human, HL-60 cells, Peptide Partial, 10 aa] [Homo sapiens]
LRVAPEEHPV